MTADARPLACTRCGQQCGVAEDVESCIDWGPAVVGDDGIVRPQYPDAEDGYQEVWSVVRPLRRRAFCVNPDCRHQWTLRRYFDPVPTA
ncbi:hypothetical protein GCM10011583_18360 [Streptomyces camponoticapitis]|uniref:Uncharacterized protein n=1 Tax=Streptomyces camponoticapitis TaxID=1616125 RepID=A0ABQ2E446_9ACTN|nr:hypothetical protein [Streptomyces camponoticapitis]GGJ87142.1 hypothetical protein GCM10011583_18360 [Streptomyces camponoticapitis]